MPVTNKLCDNGRILYRVIADPWTVEDLLRADALLKLHYDQANDKVHMLVNVRGARRVPPAVYRLGRGMTLSHPNSGYIALVGASSMTRRLAENIFRIACFDRARFFDIEEDAWAFLRQFTPAER